MWHPSIDEISQVVCPAGNAVACQYLTDKKAYVQQIVKPLIKRAEPVCVVAGGPAEARVKSNPQKQIRYAKLRQRLQ